MAPLLLPACAGSRYTHGRIKDVSGEEVYTSMQAELVQCETLHGRARVNMDDDGVQSMLADITMQTDSFIGISMRVLGMEVARIYITADSVQIMDRVNKQYLPRSMADFLQGLAFLFRLKRFRISCWEDRFGMKVPGILSWPKTSTGYRLPVRVCRTHWISTPVFCRPDK